MKKIILTLIIGSIAIAPVCAMDVADQTALNEDLVEAAAAGNLHKVKDLIEKGADAGYRPTEEPFTTALKEVARNSNIFFASDNDRLEIMKLLIKNGAKVNEIEPRSGTTALIYAVAFGTPEMVQALIQAGADLSHRDTRGETAFIWAISTNKKDTILLLLEAITKLTEQEKESVINWLHFNKDMQGQGRAFLPRDTRTLITNDIVESLAMELKKRAVYAGVLDPLVNGSILDPLVNGSIIDKAAAQHLHQYLDLNFLRDLVISQSKISRK